MARVQLASLPAGTVINSGLGSGVIAGASVMIYLHGTATLINVYALEVGGTTLATTGGTGWPLTTDSQGRVPGYADEGQRVDVVASKGGTTALTVEAQVFAGSGDGPVATATLRTLGPGSQQAAAGNDPRIISCDEYFVAGDADDAASISRAQAALPTSGGTIRFRNRAYVCASVPFSFDSTSGIVLQGAGGGTGGGGLGGVAGGGTEILYTGATARFISARNSQAFTIRDIAIYYTNASFTGALVDFSSSFGTPATNMALEHVSLESGGASPHTATLLNLDNAICGTFTKVQFMQANIAIAGKSVNTNFSNAHTFKDCLFQGQATIHVHNVGAGWTFEGCTWEPLSNGKGGAFSHDSGVRGENLTLIGGGTVDATVSGGVQLTWAGSGLNIFGTEFGIESTGTTAIKVDENNCSGIVVIGAYFFCAPAASATAFDWGSTTGHTRVVRFGCVYQAGVVKDAGTLPGDMIDQVALGMNLQQATDGTISISSNATNTPQFQMNLTGTTTTPVASLQVFDTANWRTLLLNPSGGSVIIGAGGPTNGVGLNGNSAVAKAAAITSPTAPSAVYVQAEATAMKTAVDAIRVALQAIGITA